MVTKYFKQFEHLTFILPMLNHAVSSIKKNGPLESLLILHTVFVTTERFGDLETQVAKNSMYFTESLLKIFLSP